MLNKDKQILESMLEAMDKIFQYTSEFNSADGLYEDEKSFDAALMNFVVLGELTEKLSDNLKNQTPSIEWHKIKGFRNILAHDYFGIDAEEVWQIIQNRLPELTVKIQNILQEK